jgi:steroid 5-alpha reductase family enzyme
MSRVALVLTVLVGALAFMTAAWAVSVARRDAGVVDRAWGLACALVAWIAIVAAAEPTVRSYLAAGFVTVWGVRLSAHLTWRSRGRGENWRYRRLRERHGRSFAARSLVTVFWAQGAAAVVVGLPLLAAVRVGQPAALGWLDLLGAAVWAVGFGTEAAADAQLARFHAAETERTARRVLDRGLWRYSRHPNYFGDAVQWWGVGLVGLAAGASWALVGPLVMTAVLVRGTGVAAIEPHLLESRGEAYRRYVATTSALVPGPPRGRAARHG